MKFILGIFIILSLSLMVFYFYDQHRIKNNSDLNYKYKEMLKNPELFEGMRMVLTKQANVPVYSFTKRQLSIISISLNDPILSKIAAILLSPYDDKLIDIYLDDLIKEKDKSQEKTLYFLKSLKGKEYIAERVILLQILSDYLRLDDRIIIPYLIEEMNFILENSDTKSEADNKNNFIILNGLLINRMKSLGTDPLHDLLPMIEKTKDINLKIEMARVIKEWFPDSTPELLERLKDENPNDYKLLFGSFYKSSYQGRR